MKYLLEFIIASLVAMFMAVMLVEWAAGCGETYVDFNGGRHANECIFVR
jgi:hypothetical protein